MKKPSLKERILKYIRNSSGWVNGGELERLAENNGYKASNASRRCRELENKKHLERKIERSSNSKIASVWYRAKPPVSTIVYKLEDGTVVSTKKIYE